VRLADGVALDFEAAGDLSLRVRATNTENGAHVLTEAFTVDLRNVNEAPDGTSTSINIDEDTPRSLTTGDFGFTDPDAGDTISGVRIDTIPSIGSLALNGVAVTAGQIVSAADIAAGNLVFTPATHAHGASHASFSFTVRDTGGLFDLTQNALTVDVTAVNDAPTDIAVTGGVIQEDVASGGSIGTAFTSAGQVVATLSAVDADSGDTFTYAIVGGDSAKYEIVGNEIRVKAGVTLDFETDASDSVTVRVTDASGATFHKAVAITIADFEGVYTGTSGNDTITGTSEEDIIAGGDGNDWLIGSAGADVFDGGTGNNWVDYSASGAAVTVNLATGMGAGGDAEGDQLSNVVSIRGSAHADTLIGDDAGNIFQSGLGADTLEGGGGSDIASYVMSADAVTVDLADGLAEQGGDAEGDVLISIESLTGSTLNDTLRGNDAQNWLYAGEGNDILDGRAGNDHLFGQSGHDNLEGGAGNDTLDGGAGNDTAIYSGNWADYAISYNAGTATYTLTDRRPGSPDGTDTVKGVEQFQFADRTITVTTPADLLNDAPTAITVTGGTIQEDVASGGSIGTAFASAGQVVATLAAVDADGGDTFTYAIVGGDSAKYEIVGNEIRVKAGVVLDHETDASDSVTVRVTDASGATFDKAVAITITDYEGAYSGSGGNDNVTGASEEDTIIGGGGNDIIDGGDGADTVVGGASNDTLRGGNGDDTFLVGPSDGFDQFDGGAGADRILATGDNTVIGFTADHWSNPSLVSIEEINANGFSNVTLKVADWQQLDLTHTTLVGIVRIEGSGVNETITGSAAADTIVGGSGRDVLSGGDGNDLFLINAGETDFDQINGGAGTNDRILATGNNTVIGLQGSHWSVSGVSGIEQIDAGGFANVIIKTGDWGNIDLTGVTLTGIDRIEGAGWGERLTGSAGADQILGLAGDDILSGGDGNDTMTGGAGADTIDGGDGADIAVYSGNWSDYSISLANGTYTITDRVAGRDGTDTVTGVETFRFNGVDYAAAAILNDAPTDITARTNTLELIEFDPGDRLVAGVGSPIAGSNTYTIEFWARADKSITMVSESTSGAGGTAGQNYVVFPMHGGSTGEAGLGVSLGTNGVQVFAHAAGHMPALLSFAGDIGGTHHIAVVVTNNTPALYVDGVLVHTGLQSTMPTYTRHTVGDQGTGYGAFDGAIGEARIWNTARTGQEIADHRFTAAAGNEPGLTSRIASENGTIVSEGSAALLPVVVGTLTMSDLVLVQENALAGTVVATLARSDVDVGDTATYTITGGDAAKYEIVGNEIRVKAGASLDHETDAADTLTVQVTDASGATYSETISIQITNQRFSQWGGAGVDTLTGTAEEDTIDGGGGDDVLSGAAGADTINGGLGNDRLAGGAGADRLTGGGGWDYLDYATDTAGVTVDLGLNTASGGDAQGDIISGFNGVYGGSGQDRLTSHSGGGILLGGGGNDTLIAVGGTGFWGEAGNDTLTGGAGIDTYNANHGAVSIDLGLSGSGTATINGSETDTFTSIENVSTGVHNDIIVGSDLGNVIGSGAGNDVINARGGADSINAGDGNDTITGGAGNDVIDGGAGSDIAVFAGRREDYTVTLSNGTYTVTDNVAGRDGVDTIVSVETFRFLGDAAGHQDWAAADVQDIVLGAGNDSVTHGAGRQFIRDAGGANTINTGDGADTVFTTGGSNTITLGAGDDRYINAGGNDWVEGGAGADHIDGGVGSHGHATYGSSDFGVTVNLADGLVERGGHAEGDVLVNISAVDGSAHVDTIIGDAASNWIQGMAGGDFLDGGAGSDRLAYNSSDSGVTVNLGSGFADGGHATGDTIFSFENIVGSSFADVLTGSSGDNGLQGMSGADIIDGGDGLDTAEYNFSAAGVTVDLTLATQVSGGDASGDQLLNIESVSGSNHADILRGDAAQNWLSGHSGDDTLEGRGGNDILSGGAGNDIAVFTGRREDYTVTLDNGTYTITDSVAGRDGVDTVTGVETFRFQADQAGSQDWLAAELMPIVGSNGADGINAGAGRQFIQLLDGDDWANGGDGDDLIQGGAGNEWINAGAGADRIDGGDGSDGADYFGSMAAVTINLATGFVGGGAADGDQLISIENVAGSAQADTLTGDGQANTIEGRAGADLLDGGAGVDTLSYWNSSAGVTVNIADGLAEAGGDAEGDTVSNFEHITGSFHDDVLTGDSGANFIAGLGGADIIDGGGGYDAANYWSSDAAVTVNLATGAATGGHATGDTLINIEQIAGSNDFGDTLTGNADHNWLHGYGGDDVIVGGEGGDTIYGDVGNDTLFGDASGVNLIQNGSFEHFTGGGAFSNGWIPASLSNWTVTGPRIELTNGSPTDSLYALDLDASPGNLTISQTISGLSSGQTYDFSLDIIDPGGFDAGVDIYFGGQLVARLNEASLSDNSWRTLTYTVTGGMGDGTNALRIVETGAPDNAGMVIDNLRLTTSTGDTLDGGAGNDTLYGGGGNDTILGGDGNDVIVFSQGNDTIDAGAGTDTIRIDRHASEMVFWRDAGTGRLGMTDRTEWESTGTREDSYIANAETLVFLDRTISLADMTFASDGDDTFNAAAGGSVAVLNLGNDVGNGGAGNDFLLANGGNDTLFGGAGDDILNVGNDADWADGGDGNDVLVGQHGADALYGGAGNDTLEGGGENDRLYGGAGNDRLVAGTSSGLGMTPEAFAAANNLVYNGETGSFYRIVATPATWEAANSAASNTFVNGVSGRLVQIDSASENAAIGSMVGPINVWHGASDRGGEGNWQWSDGAIASGQFWSGNHTGSAQNGLYNNWNVGEPNGGTNENYAHANYAMGGVWNDHNATQTFQYVIEWDAGQLFGDLLEGGAGADILQGGAGIDTASYRGAAAGVTVNLTTGAGSGSDAQGDVLTSIENIVGSNHADTLQGDATANWLTGGEGSDTIYGEAGDDTLEGGAGNDWLFFGDGADTVRGGDGDDYIDDVFLWTGASGDNFLDGGDGNDTIYAAGGNDTVIGGAGNDQLFGEAGADNIDGGDRDDTIYGQSWLDSGSESDILHGGGGNDYVDGGGGDDTITGGDGADTLVGGAGNDTIDGGAGTDTAVFSGARADYSVTLTNGTYTIAHAGGAGANGTDTLTGIENFQFADGTLTIGNVLGAPPTDLSFSGSGASLVTNGSFELGPNLGFLSIANAPANWTLSGNVGHHVDAGRASNGTGYMAFQGWSSSGGGVLMQTLATEAGKSYTLSFDSKWTLGATGTFSMQIEALNASGVADLNSAFTDTTVGVNATQTYTFTATSAFTTLRFTDRSAGNAGDFDFDNVQLVATSGPSQVAVDENAANGTVVTSASNTGGYGITWSLDDNAGGRFSINASGQITVANGALLDHETSAFHTVTVRATTQSGSYTEQVSVHVRDVAAQVNGNGNANTLNGTSEDDQIIATQGGNDTLNGGGGNDTLYAGAGADSIAAGEGADFVSAGEGNDGVTGDAGADAIYAGGGVDTVSGGEGNDIISGEAGADTLSGDAGNDVISGGAGVDSIDGGAGNDLLLGDMERQSFDSLAAMNAAGWVGVGHVNVDEGQNYGWQGTNEASGEASGEFGGTVARQMTTMSSYQDTSIGGTLTNSDAISFTTKFSITASSSPDLFIAMGFSNANQTQSVGFAVSEPNSGVSGFAGFRLNAFVTGASGTTGSGLIEIVQGADYQITLTYAGNAVTLTATALNGGAGGGSVTVGSSGSGAFSLDRFGFWAGGMSVYESPSNTMQFRADDVIYSNASGGADTLLGGDGNDRFIADAGAAADTITGGAGMDTLDYSLVGAGVTLNIATTGAATASGGAGADIVEGIENLIGTSFSDDFSGTNGANFIDGGAGADTIGGADGDDILRGGTGNDTISGGAGTDTVDYQTANGGVTVNIASLAATNRGADAGSDTFSSIEGAIGSRFNDTLTGGSASEQFRGGAGNDTISAGGGANIVSGDNLILNGSFEGGSATGWQAALGFEAQYAGQLGANEASDGRWYLELDRAGGDQDVIWQDVATVAGQTYTLSFDFGARYGGASDAFEVYWNGQLLQSVQQTTQWGWSTATFTVTGTGALDRLEFRELPGSDGGGAFLDNVRLVSTAAAEGNDTITGGSDADILMGDGGNDVISAGEGSNTVLGGAGNDSITAGSGADWIYGGAGDDAITAGGGADHIDGGSGVDILNFSGAAVYANLASGLGFHGVGTTASQAQGDRIVGIENIEGTANGDIVIGDAGANRLIGVGGADLLVGDMAMESQAFSSADAMTAAGWTATNTTNASTSYGFVNENHAGGGTGELGGTFSRTDQASKIVDTTLGGTLTDNNVLTFTTKFTPTGVAHGDQGLHLGWMSADGAHFIGVHFDERDTSSVDLQIRAAGPGGVVYSGTPLDMDVGVDYTLTFTYNPLTGVASISAVGASGGGSITHNINAIGDGGLTEFGLRQDAHTAPSGAVNMGLRFDDIAYTTANASSGNDTIEGGAGADSMIGGAGVDTLSYEASTTAVTVDLATGAASGGDAAGDLFSGFENIIGGTGADTLAGDAGANTIDGGSGDDTLTGGLGADTLAGGDGSDIFLWQRGDGNDNVSGGAGGSWIDAIDLKETNGSLDFGTDWTVTLTSGSYTHDAANDRLILSADSDGTITINATGETIAFNDIEQIRWGP
jgi:Ca2+-binding RTX toxin-like protein